MPALAGDSRLGMARHERAEILCAIALILPRFAGSPPARAGSPRRSSPRDDDFYTALHLSSGHRDMGTGGLLALRRAALRCRHRPALGTRVARSDDSGVSFPRPGSSRASPHR